jgi:hypothetical protein
VLFLAVSLFILGNLRKAIPRVLVSAAVFLCVVAPYMAVVSRSSGDRFSLAGDATFTYICRLYDAPYALWEGKAGTNIKPKHPVKKLFDAPAVYEYAAPVKGTYPIAHDPLYWYEGTPIVFNVGRQIKLAHYPYQRSFSVFSFCSSSDPVWPHGAKT